MTGGVTTTDLSTTDRHFDDVYGAQGGHGGDYADLRYLDSIPTGVITVTVGDATQVRVETSADGSGTIVPTQEISAGTSITMYAVTRDAYGNYRGQSVCHVDGDTDRLAASRHPI